MEEGTAAEQDRTREPDPSMSLMAREDNGTGTHNGNSAMDPTSAAEPMTSDDVAANPATANEGAGTMDNGNADAMGDVATEGSDSDQAPVTPDSTTPPQPALDNDVKSTPEAGAEMPVEPEPTTAQEPTMAEAPIMEAPAQEPPGGPAEMDPPTEEAPSMEEEPAAGTPEMDPPEDPPAEDGPSAPAPRPTPPSFGSPACQTAADCPNVCGLFEEPCCSELRQRCGCNDDGDSRLCL